MPIRGWEADLFTSLWKVSLWPLVAGLWLGFAAISVNAACYDPVGGSASAGQFRYMPDYKEYRHCDGTYWQSMATRTSIAGTCTAGTMTVTSNDLRMCNGTSWLSMTGAANGSCTIATGAVAYDGSSKLMRFCNGTNNRTVGLQLSDTAAVVSSGSPWLQLYDTAGNLRPAPASTPSSKSYAVAYSPSGNYLAMGQFSTPYIRVYDVTNNYSAVSVAAIPDMATSFSWKSDGSRLALGIYVTPFFTVYDTTTSPWTRLSVTDVPSPPAQARGVSYHPNGNLIATIGSALPYLVFYDTTTLPYTKPTLITGGNAITTAGGAVAFSPNGRYLAVGLDNSPYLVVYQTSDWSPVSLGGLPTAKVRSLAWHPDSSVLITGSTGGTLLHHYSAATWAMSTPFSVQPTGGVPGLAFNSRGTILGVTMVDNTPNRYITYETYNWTKLTNVSTAPSVDATDTVYGVSFRPGQ